MKKFIALAVAGLALAGCAVPAETSEPAPTVTVTAPAPEPEDTFSVSDIGKDGFLILWSTVWNDSNADEQYAMCMAYYGMPFSEVYDAVTEGLGEDVDPEWIDEAMSTSCDSL